MSDLLIEGGLVVDGTGAAPSERDVLVTAGHIEAVVPAGEVPSAHAARTVDARGLAVAPGFIDIHTHSDVSVLLDGRAQSKVHQGVTTEVSGNCGFSPFPFTEVSMRQHLDLLAGIGDDPVEPGWSDLVGYAAAVEASGVAINVAPLVGHGQLRIAARGTEGGRPSGDEQSAMRALLTELLEQGAFGLSTGLTYVPSCYADSAELEDLCTLLAEYDAIYATHARGRGAADVDEVAHFGRNTGARMQYSHIAINAPDQWGTADEILGRFEAARASGVDIACDVYPYDASASALTQYLPAWVQEGGIDAMRDRLADTAVLDRAEADLAAGWGRQHRIPWLWDRVVLARTDGVLDAPEGATLEQAAAEAGMSEARYVLELCRAGGNRVQAVLFYRTEEDMRAFLRYEATLVGSDGSAIPFDQQGRRPHPRAFGAHARVLGRYVRELGDLDLATAVHHMTGAVAQRLGITGRGIVVAGNVADLVVFDPATVVDRATFLAPNRSPAGISHVLVNGEFVVDGASQTAARPGKVLRAR